MNRLTAAQMADLCLEALANARRLHTDATLMRVNGRLPTAYMLAGMAADELGKHIQVAAFFQVNDDTGEAWRKFWRRFRRHEAKLGNALLTGWDATSFDPQPDARAVHRARLSATYVDVEEGTVQVPEIVIAEADVVHIFGLLDQAMTQCESTLGNVERDRLASVMEQARRSEEKAKFRRLVDHEDPRLFGLGVLAMVGGVPAEDAAEFVRHLAPVLAADS